MGADQSTLQLSDENLKRTKLSFRINGKEYTVTTDMDDFGPDSLLVDFIRDRAGLKGTKYMCREGGCGICCVTVKSRDPNTGDEFSRTVNSCLMPLFGCDGWDITTIEKLGTVKTGLHTIQQRMVNFSGTQCGFCTPGWVMNMYGMMESKKPLAVKDIEDSLDGNICRCTGYRPIIDAMKSLAVDASEELRRKCGDLNGSASCVGCPCATQNQKSCGGKLLDENDSNENQELTSTEVGEDFEAIPIPLHLDLKSGEQWVKATDLNTLFTAIQKFQAMGLKYRVVAGNTGTGVYKHDGPFNAFVEINSIPILTKINVNPTSVILGGAVTLSKAIEAMKSASEIQGYEYCKQIVKHWSRVANTPVRNAATIAGNLMMKHAHREFPSDIFLVLETIGAMLTIATAPGNQRMYSIQEFLGTDMRGKIIFSIHFPKLKSNYYFRSFKITRRYQNAHAYVNAGFLMQIDPKRNFSVRDKPNIVFGGISPTFVRAAGTEVFFVGKFLDEKTIQGAMAVLDKELQPDISPPDADPMYRKALAQSLLYKFILGIMAETVKPQMKTGGEDIEHGLSYGKQTYDSDKSEWPLYQPVPKIEGPMQVTGEAEYTNDIHPEWGELFGAFVISKQGNATLSKIDASAALKIPGVFAFVDAKDIPGTNNFMTTADPDKPDVIFVQDKISYAGQPIGLILAENRQAAFNAVKLVEITYSDIQPPVLDIPTALEKAKRENRLESCLLAGASSPRIIQDDPPHKIKGEFKSGSQYHFHMEPQTVLCIPKEDGMNVYSATQWITQVQAAVASALALPSNAINVQVKRLGGAFGAKLARATHVACAGAVAANKVNRPVRIVLDIETNMSMMGKRLPYLFKYEVGFDDTGKIHSLNCQIFCDAGCTSNEPTAIIAMLSLQSAYASNGWKVVPGHVNTNTPPNTYCRAPGSPQAIACIEYIMDHIAFNLKKDPLDVRAVNYIKKGDPILTAPDKKLDEENTVPQMLQDLKTTADLEDRMKFIQNYNQTNRWRKRGISLVPMRYPIHYWFSGYSIFISIYAKDGSIALTHSGIEMGQGINTKVAQVVARQLKIPLDKIKVKASSSLTSPNAVLTGGSMTSEHVCYAALKACENLNKRFEPVKAKLENPSWELLIAECIKLGMDLSSYYSTTYADGLKDYNVWGLAAAEVEIDCLTGEYKLIRVDLINDAGMSLSPEVDVGQVEGSFIMGMGFWLTEKLQHDKSTGELLTNRTWDYKPPLAKDIPEDFRITLLKNASNPHGVLRSKATGEAPLSMSFCVLLAIKKAIEAARMDAGNNEWFDLHGPVTPEEIHNLCLTSTKQFVV